MNIDWATTLGIASAIASTVLAIVAMAQSLYFYNQSKNSERIAAETLAAIRAQVSTLERIAGKQLDRLTKFATQPERSDVTYAVTLIRELSSITAASAPASPPSASPLADAVVYATYNKFYFAALANVGFSAFMLENEVVEEGDAYPYAIIDESHRFFFAALNELLGMDSDLRRLDLLDRFNNCRSEMEPLISTAAHIRERRESQTDAG